jgi:hypothetical protein
LISVDGPHQESVLCRFGLAGLLHKYDMSIEPVSAQRHVRRKMAN